jgi:hypothetical protein
MAAPMPREAPVTMATLLVNGFMVCCLSKSGWYEPSMVTSTFYR